MKLFSTLIKTMSWFKKVILTVIIGNSVMFSTAFAEEAKPLGLTLGKTTIEEFKTAFPKNKEIGIGQTSKGPIFTVEYSLIPLDHVQSAKFYFDCKGKLITVNLAFPRQDFQHLYELMKEKYTLEKEDGLKDIPLLGGYGKLFANFTEGNVYIDLESENTRSATILTYWIPLEKPVIKQKQSLPVQEQRKLL